MFGLSAHWCTVACAVAVASAVIIAAAVVIAVTIAVIAAIIVVAAAEIEENKDNDNPRTIVTVTKVKSTHKNDSFL